MITRFTSRLYSKLKLKADLARKEYHHTEEAKSKIRESQVGRPKAPFSEEHIRKMSESRKGKEPWNKGRRGDKASQAIKDKMKKTRSALKFKLSDEGTEKISTRAKLYIVCYDKYYMQNVSILPLGAGCEVGRSCLILTINNKKIMLDCGLMINKEDTDSLPLFSHVNP